MKFISEDPTAKTPGFYLPRTLWTTLNSIRIDQGECNYYKKITHYKNGEWQNPFYVAVGKCKLPGT